MPDKVLRMVTGDAAFRAVIVWMPKTAQTLITQHNPSPEMGSYLANTAIASLLLAASLKGQGALSIRIETNGLIGIMSADGTPNGLVRAMIAKANIEDEGIGKKLKLPIIGPLIQKVAVARFTRTLGTLISSGDPVFDAAYADSLLKYPALLAPEYEISQFESLYPPLERCVIYDVGTRAFQYLEYLEDVKEYWLSLFESNMTYEEIYHKRFPESDYRKGYKYFLEHKKNMWGDIGDEILKSLYAKYRNRWNKKNRSLFETKEYLRNFCLKKIKKIKEVMR